MGKIIGITYDLKSDWQPRDDDPVDASAEFDSPETVGNIIRSLEWGGYTVKRIGNVNSLLSQIETLDVDIVFNICEGRLGRNRESQVPVILEMFNIPFVGSDGLTLAVTLDKVVAKKCFMAEGVPTPRFLRAFSVEDLKDLKGLRFPLIVKTSQEGTSKGLSEKSRVEDMAALKKQVQFIIEKYKQPALVEEFIRGTEFTVAVMGNQDPQAMPVVQISIDGRTELGDDFYTYARVVNSVNTVKYICPAKISETLTRKLQDIAVKAYQAVDCRDFGRVDFRVDEKGNPYVLEINPLPNLGLQDVFNLFPQVLGLTYEEIINRILELGLQRYGLSAKKASRSSKEALARK